MIRCSSSTSQSTCLLRARDIRDRLLSDTQLDENCLRVGEPINAQQMNSYLPSFGCLFLSPLNLWSNDISNIINNEREILELIPSLSKRYADIIFGIPQKYFSSTKPLTYAITLLLTNASNEFRQDIKKRLFALEEQTTSQDDIIHIYFSKKPLLYYLPLVLIYIVVFLYIYYSVSKYFRFKNLFIGQICFTMNFRSIRMCQIQMGFSIGSNRSDCCFFIDFVSLIIIISHDTTS